MERAATYGPDRWSVKLAPWEKREIERLAASPNPADRMGAAAHPRAPKRVLRELAMDPDTYVREFVAGNLRTPRSVRLRLLSDTAPLVRMSASWTFDGSTIREQQELVECAKRNEGRLLVFGEWIRIPTRWRDVATS